MLASGAMVGVFVRHRIDGLEKNLCSNRLLTVVRHRIDGLEKTCVDAERDTWVRHRIDGLENGK